MAGRSVPERPYSPPPDTDLDCLYEDAFLIAANKPSGLLSVPGRGADKAVSALTILSAWFGPLHVVHRLDMDTSGLIVFARSAGTARQLSALFEARAVQKTYHALVHGRPADSAGTITLPIGRSWDDRPRRRIDPENGKPSVTNWRLVRHGKGRALLELQPETGRTHQLRVHLAAIGHPIIGDPLYSLEDTQETLCLHASRLRFEHPWSGQKMDWSTPVPFASGGPAQK